MKRIAAFTSPLLKDVKRRPAFLSAGIITDWPLIVGNDFAKFCQVERVVLARVVQQDLNNVASNQPAPNNLGKIYISTVSAFATQISYLAPQLLEKINRYFGYQAIGEIIISHKSNQNVLKKNESQNQNELKKLPIDRDDFESLIDDKAIQNEKLASTLKRLEKYFVK